MLNVIYRTYPGYNKKKSLIAFSEKKDLVKVGLSSLLEALEGLDSIIHVVVDNPNNEYLEFLREIHQING